MRLFTVCISNYVSVAWSQHIRNVLKRLAQHTRTLVYQTDHPEHIEDDLRYQGQCELHLEAILTIFFLVAAFSFVDDHSDATYNLTEPLPPQPSLPDDQGRDILLAGILSTPEQAWREDVTSLLCAAFFVEKEEEVFYIMRQWTTTIEELIQTDTSRQQPLQTAYHNFIINLYHTMKAWETDPQRTGFVSVPASATFRYYLSSWVETSDWNGSTNSTFIRNFTQSALAQMEG